ncbi:hypothetical protein GSS88_00150 [Corynebacterium sp. 3HC-13]|uniref:DUF6668 family protein n=1 Tax=Corynebacterium poyangense TaxID=2684405 RepID=UPI001CCC4F2B|nr:DUF6668 family protein [Corynebacterium poyangense]MBZ8176221.1 hypothetical protein [Corynebacterium poyangense]
MKVRVDQRFLLPLSQYRLHDEQITDQWSSWRPAVWLVAAHGGAGVTTLACQIGPCGDAGGQFPVKDDSPLCVVVCRATSHGLEAAHNVVLQAQGGLAGHCEVIGVIVVADTPGKIVKRLTHKIDVISQLTTVWQVPYLRQLAIQDRDDGLELEIFPWTPDYHPEVKRRRLRGKTKKIDVTSIVHPVVADIAGELMALARKRYVEIFGLETAPSSDNAKDNDQPDQEEG